MGDGARRVDGFGNILGSITCVVGLLKSSGIGFDV